MGIFQSIGGAATSGKGLTGMQVAAALRSIAAKQRERHNERVHQQELEDEVTEFTTPARSKSFVHQSVTNLSDDAYGATAEMETELVNGKGEKETIKVSEYAPEVFRFLRQLEGVSEDVFADEWTLPLERLSLEMGEGRSMALFLKSKTMDFMSKTIAPVEVEVLMGMLQSYTEYLAKNINSLLMRFLMLLRVEVKGETGYILCFKDSFSSCLSLNERWDIKGRVPKPGKYLHFPKFIHRPMDILGESDDTVKEPELPTKENSAKPPHSGKLQTMKDKDLTRLFWLHKTIRERVVNQLLADYEFLYKEGLLDYSILIGIHYNDEDGGDAESPKTTIRSMKMTYALGRESEASIAEIRPESPRLTRAKSNHHAHHHHHPHQQQQRSEKTQQQKQNGQTAGLLDDDEDAPGVAQQNEFKEKLSRMGSLSDFNMSYIGASLFADGVDSIERQETYYIAVIDMLTTFTWKKKTANFCKKTLWKTDTISTLPPKEYYERIVKYTQILFPKLEDD